MTRTCYNMLTQKPLKMSWLKAKEHFPHEEKVYCKDS